MFAAYNIEMSWLEKDARSGLRCKYVTKDGTIVYEPRRAEGRREFVAKKS